MRKPISGLSAFVLFLAFSPAAPLSSGTASSQEIPMSPVLPLVQDVLYPPSPVQSGGKVHLFYELHLTNFLAREVTLLAVDILDEEGRILRTLGKIDIAARLVRAGKRPNPEETCVLESGIRAVVFLKLVFDNEDSVPASLTHRLTAEFARRGGENSTMQGVGRPVPVLKKEPLILGPPLRPGVWLAGNGPGDGPVGHRLSMQTWNGRLVVNQRYALDFMKFSGDNRLVKGDSSINGNWCSYGEEVLAVADGVVVEVKDGVIENTPGEDYAVPADLEHAAGNYVVLQIGPEAYADYAHLRPNSLKVKAGNRVRKGQVLGLIGNAGISDAPHLHFHVIDAAPIFGGESIPYVFEEFEMLGPFDNLDDNLDKPWAPQGPASKREKELPLGDIVIRFDR
jgi:hypothetical protein